jgi:hypothetical protein
MANTHKDIIIVPNRSSDTADPNISFRGANSASNTEITLRVYPDSNGTLSFEGSAGQLFSITNDLTGTIFSVNDVSGIPSLEIDASGFIELAAFGGNVGIGEANTSNINAKLYVKGDLNTIGNVGIGGTTSNSAYIAFYGIPSDGAPPQTPYRHTYIGERMWGNTIDNSELFIYKGNDASNDRIRILSSNYLLNVYNLSFATTNTFEEMATANSNVAISIANSTFVGIGMMNPTEQLHVSGNVNATNFILSTGVNVRQRTKKIVFRPESASYPATNFAQYKSVSGTNFPVESLAFDTTTEESAFFKFNADEYGSGNLTLKFHWYADANSTTGAGVVWEASLACITPDTDSQDIETKAFATVQNVADTHIGTTGQRLHVASLTLTNTDSITANDYCVLKVARKPGNASDTMTGDALLVEVDVEYSTI